jgi:hypothetical protein
MGPLYVTPFYVTPSMGLYGTPLCDSLLFYVTPARVPQMNEFLTNPLGKRAYRGRTMFPPLLTVCVRAALLEAGSEVVMCVGEADFALSTDGACPDVYGVLSNDSDFALTHGVRFFPARSLKVEKMGHVTCEVLTPALASSLLGVAAHRFAELAVLAGNDSSPTPVPL